MGDFYIKKLIVTGAKKEPSSIDFTDGLNIVCGPSDTGKSYIVECIDYIFGSENIPIDENMGYDTVKMVIETERGAVTAERVFNTRKLKVSSTDELIESGDYGTKTGSLNANTDLWLRLIGVEGRRQIVHKKTFEKKLLTWRFFLHMFLIREERVIQRTSVLLPRQNTANTGALSSLLFLITGQDFLNVDPREEKKIRVAKKAAVEDYINARLKTFADRKIELGEHRPAESVSLYAEAESIIDEISRTESQISDAIKHNRRLLAGIMELNASLAECNTLYSRYQAYKTQMASDIERLVFIAEGKARNTAPQKRICPICDSELPHDRGDETFDIEASRGEYRKISRTLRDLEESETELVAERDELEHSLAELESEQKSVGALLDGELKPRAQGLKRMLAEYRKAMEVQDELAFIGGLEAGMRAELFEAQFDGEESGIDFNVKKRFDRKILDKLDAYIERILRECKYENLGSARLGPARFDVLVNEKDKSSFGKGYRAFLNTVLSLALMEYLSDCGKHSPGILIVDSPILSLKERGAEKATDSMKSALFQYLIDHQESGQVLVVENDIPELEYGGKANVIRFTKDETEGRYGFLADGRRAN
jgi:hypothetical protein